MNNYKIPILKRISNIYSLATNFINQFLIILEYFNNLSSKISISLKLPKNSLDRPNNLNIYLPRTKFQARSTRSTNTLKHRITNILSMTENGFPGSNHARNSYGKLAIGGYATVHQRARTGDLPRPVEVVARLSRRRPAYRRRPRRTDDRCPPA